MHSLPTILVADDDSNDVFFLRRAIQKAGLLHPVMEVRDGERAILYLSGKETYSDRAQYPIPAMLFLDLKMPKVSGFEVLEWLRSQQALAGMKVIVLSSSGLPRDIERARLLGAHDYRIKPADIDEMITMVKDVAIRWLNPGDAETSGSSL